VNRIIDCSVNSTAPSANGDWAMQSGSSYGRSIDWIDRTVFAACRLDTSMTETSLAAQLRQLGNVPETGSLRSFARILSVDCSKMPRIGPLTTAIPSLKIKNLVPFSGTDWKAVQDP